MGNPKVRPVQHPADATSYKPQHRKIILSTKPTQITKGTQIEIKNLQQQLNQLGFNTGGINGILTPQTKNALYQAEIHGYRIEANKLVKKDEEFFKKLNSRKANYSNNYPPAEAIKDAIVGTGNRMYRYITGNNDYIIKNPDVNDIPASQKEVLKTRYKHYAPKGGDLIWDEQKYLQEQGTYTNGDRNYINFEPHQAIEYTLGQYMYKQDPKTGDVYVLDTYDWNIGDGTPNQGLYTEIRKIAGRLGSKNNEPDKQKKHYNINLGNPNNWK